MAPTILTEALPHPVPSALPALSSEASAHMVRVREHITQEIDALGFLPFDRFMHLALYAPGLGYYSAGAAKFGASGDFVTAPEISPLFGATVAQQIAELIERGCPRIVELGAGTGCMAADILFELARIDRVPVSYEIVEVSADLRERQSATLRTAVPDLIELVRWCDRLPDGIEGVILGNEVLDALPVGLVRMQGGVIHELGVTLNEDRSGFRWSSRPAGGELLQAAAALRLPEGYRSEVHLAARGLVRSVADSLKRGVALFIDYGFPVSEYYHAQRSEGTLMCHYRHHAHADPLCLPGLQDITSHLDFTALADTATSAELDLLGYTTHARFLMNCGILDALGRIDPQDVTRYAPVCTGVQKLLSPAEMGELFKVIAFGRDIAPPLRGFRAGDRSGLL